MSALIEFQQVCKYYQMGDTTVGRRTTSPSASKRGEFVAIVGQSGSGKSTCMNIIGCLDVPTSGTYLLDGGTWARWTTISWPRSATSCWASSSSSTTCCPS